MLNLALKLLLAPAALIRERHQNQAFLLVSMRGNLCLPDCAEQTNVRKVTAWVVQLELVFVL